MPYKSDAQRKYMHAVHPEIAKRWDAEIAAKKEEHLKARIKMMRPRKRRESGGSR